jgi:hypothetical protein
MKHLAVLSAVIVFILVLLAGVVAPLTTQISPLSTVASSPLAQPTQPSRRS